MAAINFAQQPKEVDGTTESVSPSRQGITSNMLFSITPVILTFNEAPNLPRTLAQLSWAHDMVVVDSGSTDETLAILKSDPRIRVFQRLFDTHQGQWHFATHETGISSDWLLRLDADYFVTQGLIDEMAALDPWGPENGYRIAFDYAIYSRVLIASLYPPNTVLLRRNHFKIINAGHTEAWKVEGPVRDLKGKIIHDDHKSLSHWLSSQQRYARKEVDFLFSAPRSALSRIDRIRRTGWIAPLLVLPYVLFWKGCIRDGWAGWYYAFQRLLAETVIALELLDRRLRGRAPNQSNGGEFG
ncbi:MAG: glycosyltransferase family 2 protein [Rhizomicrobium sp.]